MHFLILIFFILYLLSADTIFETIIPITDESQIQDLSMLNETGEINFFIDSVRIENLEWKKIVSIQGWAFDNRSHESNSEIFILIDSGNSYKSFNTLGVKRPDVTTYYKNFSRTLDNSGFVAYIPIYHLTEGRNQIILAVRNNNGISLVKTNSYLFKTEDQVFTAFISERKNFSFPNVYPNITFHIDDITTSYTIRIKGWAFNNEQDNLDIEKFVLLESKNLSYLFDTIPAKRHDVTLFYKDLNKDLDNSGFTGIIPFNAISDGRYRIGIVLKNDNETSLIRSDRFITFLNQQVT